MITKNSVRIVLFIGTIILIVGTVLLFMQGNAPDASSLVEQDCSTENADCLVFPIVTGSNLDDVEFTLPADFAGEFNLVVITFEQEQQVAAGDWYLPLNELAQADDRLRVYNVAALPDLNVAIRLMITGGLNTAVTDQAMRDVFILLFLEDPQAFLDALEIPNTSQIILLLLDSEGRVLWQGIGEYSEELAIEIETQVEQFMN